MLGKGARAAGERRRAVCLNVGFRLRSASKWNAEKIYSDPGSSSIRVDQGCQFTSKELDLWAYVNSITLDFSRPGKPTDNAFVESFNASARLECLGQHWFMDLDDAVQKVEDWRREYNEVRPHSVIGDRTPMSLIQKPQQFAEVENKPEILT